jgi:hypothetical protein
VSAVNLTLDEASNSAASEREIQSDGGLDIDQSGSFGDDVASDDATESVDVDTGFSPELDPASVEGARFDLVALDRSLRAQPLPLKWTAGAARVRFMGPPQFGQIVGPWRWTECMTSTAWPQSAQT